MKKLVLLFSLITAVLLVSTVGAQSINEHPDICPDACDGDTVVIFPWRFGEGEQVTLRTDQEVVLAARWGTCNRGMVASFIPAARLDWLIDGEPLFGSDFDKAYYQQAASYWGEPWWSDPEDWIDLCVMNSDESWWSYWTYSLGTLEVGDYPINLDYYVSRPVRDGVDWDGDGRMDVYEGILATGKITLHIVNP